MSDPILWLLEPDNPSVRYFTLVDLLGSAPDDPEVRTARRAIMTPGPVPVILGKQQQGGHWGKPQDFYIRSKYKGTVWSIILLGQLGADSSDPRVRHAADFVLANAQDPGSGGFSVRNGQGGGGDRDMIIPCLTGNMVWSLIRFGVLDDARVQQGIEWITKYQRFDDGDAPAPRGWPYRHEQCWGKHTCTMGVIKALKALAEIPPGKRSPAVKDTITRGAEYLLKHHIFKRSHDPARVAKEDWRQLGFPLMWNTDALEMLDILTRLGYHDPRMQDAIELLTSKQGVDGRWLLESTFNGRTRARIEQPGQPSKWVTLHALRVLKRHGTI